MQISRLFNILYILIEKGQITATELSKNLEVSIRTIYRDVEALSQAGIPIYTLQGKGGGISLTDDFIFNKTLLSENEQDEILLAIQSLSALQYPELDNIFLKLSTFFNRTSNNWIEIDFSSWGNEKRQNAIFTLIKDLILKKKPISFTYYNVKGEKSDRLILPEKLLFKNNSWYLKGYCYRKNDTRTFKIGRISDAEEASDLNIELLKNSSCNKSLSSNESLPIPPVKLINMQMKVSSAGAYRVFEDFEESEITKNEDGSYSINTNLPDGEWIFNYLLSYGTLLEVFEPISIRNELVRRITEMASTYQIY